MRYLSPEDILQIHSALIDETGGTHGVRDIGIVQSASATPRQIVFGKILHPDIFQKAAAYAQIIIQHHPFLDGNKRTGITAAFVFLADNGYLAIAKRGEIEKFSLAIVHEKIDIPTIAIWFKQHTRKARIKNGSGSKK